MKLRIRAIRIRITAENGLFGCDLAFEDGLVLLRADNTMGKSTCLMSILYALGLEGTLGPSQHPPLPPVLLSQIVTDEGAKNVIESSVRVEIEGMNGRVTVESRCHNAGQSAASAGSLRGRLNLSEFDV
jgi:hypothetical protein